MATLNPTAMSPSKTTTKIRSTPNELSRRMSPQTVLRRPQRGKVGSRCGRRGHFSLRDQTARRFFGRVFRAVAAEWISTQLHRRRLRRRTHGWPCPLPLCARAENERNPTMLRTSTKTDPATTRRCDAWQGDIATTCGIKMLFGKRDEFGESYFCCFR